MIKANKQFDPQMQFELTMTQLDIEFQAVRSTLERLQWLRSKVADEYAAIRDAADQLDVMTEADFAAELEVNQALLAKHRKQFDLPHVSIGGRIRYTREQRRAACDILSTGGRAKTAAFKRAA